jgi:hypothetical protein
VCQALTISDERVGSLLFLGQRVEGYRFWIGYKEIDGGKSVKR